jgi:small subunit ribosomal protein S9
MIINEKPIKDYFSVAEIDVIDQLLRLNTNGLEGYFTVKVEGSGKHSQAEAVRHGIARLLIQVHPDLRPLLKQNGFLTRDARRKERKKPGLKRARKSPQWSKR